jgi:hypothetical protein
MPGKSVESKSRVKHIGFRLSILEENLPVKSGAGKLRCLRFRKMASRPKSAESKSRVKQIGFRLSILEENLPVKSGAGKLR